MIDPVPPPDGQGEGGPWRRLAWFLAIAIASSLVVALVAYGLRALPFGG